MKKRKKTIEKILSHLFDKALLLLVISASFNIVMIEAKILRVGHQFEARFDLVDSNSRVIANCVQNLTNTEQGQCIIACIQDERCSTFNYNNIEKICELLNISKFDEVGILRRHVHWTHYETDDDASEIGPTCEKLSPCKSFEVCEDTYQISKPYICKCRDGFSGVECSDYEGPGTTEANRASSCYLLRKRFKSIRVGMYWFKGKKETVPCKGTGDGGYSTWTSFSNCDKYNGFGMKRRFRNCTNPRPGFGGQNCSNLGPSEESVPCFNYEIVGWTRLRIVAVL